MDKVPDNMGSARQAEPQTTVVSPGKPKKADRKLLWIWIAGGAALLAALAFVLASAAFPSGTDEADTGSSLPPLLYKDGGDIYLVTGSESLRLDSTSSEGSYFFRGDVSDDGDTLI